MSFVHCQSCHRAYDLRRQPSCPACQRAEQAKQASKQEAVVELSAAAVCVSDVVLAEVEVVRVEAASREALPVSAPLESARDAHWLAEANELAETLAGSTAEGTSAEPDATPARTAESSAQSAEEIEVVLEAELVVEAEPAPRPASAALAVEWPQARATPVTSERIVSMVEELAAMLERASTSELEAARHQLQERGLKAPWSIRQLPAASGRLLAAGERLVTEAIRQPRKTVRRLASRLRDAWAGSSARA